MKYLFLILAVAVFAFFAIGSFIISAETRRKAREEEKKREELEKHEAAAAETITEANKTKADARTGNHSRDLDYMANKLHDYATK